MFSRKFIPLSGRLGNGYWIKDIVLEPDTKCNVPSFPEICTCLCKKRLAEILRQANSKKSGTSDDHIHTARKFHIQLYRIRNRRYHDHGTTVALVSDIHLVDQHCKPVRNNHLFKQSPDDPITALKYILCFYRFILNNVSSTSSHLQIGPSTITGKNPRNNAVFTRLYSAFTFPQYTSAIYPIADSV